MRENNIAEKKRGRPVGSNSFAKIKMSDLLNLVGQDGTVSVSKVWLKQLGVDLVEKPATIRLSPVTQADEQPKIEFAITSFED